MFRPSQGESSSRPARFAAPADGRLAAAMQQAYARDGFLVLEGMVEPPDCDALMTRAEQLVAGFDPTSVTSIFSTREQVHGRDRYFQESDNKIRFFFDEEAFDAAGRLRQHTRLSIKKLGHAQHDLHPGFAHFTRLPPLSAPAARLGLAHPPLLPS